jgi:hypothetical protein
MDQMSHFSFMLDPSKLNAKNYGLLLSIQLPIMDFRMVGKICFNQWVEGFLKELEHRCLSLVIRYACALRL